MNRKMWAPTLAAVIAATMLFAVVAAAVHQDRAAKVAAGSPARTNGQAGLQPDLSSPTTATSGSGSGPGSGPTTTAATAAGGGTAPGPTVKPGSAPITTASTRPGSTATTAAPSTGSGPAPTRPGTYTYSQSGTSSAGPVAATGTLVVGAPSGGTETWVRKDGSTDSTTVVLFNGSGVYTQSLTIPALNATCTFATPVAWPPWPVATGRTFSGTATCPLGATLSVAGQVLAPAAVPLAAGAVSTFIVNTVVTVAGPGLTGTLTQTDWYAPSLRLPVVTKTVSKGSATFGKTTYTVSSDETFVLASTTPT